MSVCHLVFRKLGMIQHNADLATVIALNAQLLMMMHVRSARQEST
jgi:hypothetical protein